MSLHVLVPGDWTVHRGHDLPELIERDVRAALPTTTMFTHLELLEDPRAFDDTGLDRAVESGVIDQKSNGGARRQPIEGNVTLQWGLRPRAVWASGGSVGPYSRKKVLHSRLSNPAQRPGRGEQTVPLGFQLAEADRLMVAVPCPRRVSCGLRCRESPGH